MSLAPIAGIAVALALGACSTTTYGTGTSAASQTLKDVTGILSVGGSKPEGPPIDYSPRAPIVEPPTGSLPPPGSDNAAVASAGNWPVDPDEKRKEMEAMVKEANESGKDLTFTVPDVDRPEREPDSSRSQRQDSRAVAALERSQKIGPDADKLFAEAKKSKTGSVDENGNPVRRYLTEPRAELRVPAADSPVEITEKPKKKRFSWPDLWPF